MAQAAATRARSGGPARSVTRPTGTLTKKIQRHVAYSVRMPPSSRPTAPPPTAIAAQTPMARVRGLPSSKVVVTIESAAGETSAAPRPCRRAGDDQRAGAGARPSSSDAAVKTMTPDEEQPAAAEQVGGPAAEQQETAEHERVGVDHPLQRAGRKSRSACSVGSATFTTVESSTTMNWARQTIASTSQGFDALRRAVDEGLDQAASELRGVAIIGAVVPLQLYGTLVPVVKFARLIACRQPPRSCAPTRVATASASSRWRARCSPEGVGVPIDDVAAAPASVSAPSIATSRPRRRCSTRS